MAAAKRGRTRTQERFSTPDSLIEGMRAWARSVLPFANEAYLRELGRPVLVPDVEKAAHAKATAIAQKIRRELDNARQFLSSEYGIAIGDEPQGRIPSSAVGHLWRFLRESHVASYSLDHIANHSKLLDPRVNEWEKGLEIFILEVARPTRRELDRVEKLESVDLRESIFRFGQVRSMEKLEAAATIAGFFEPLARRTLEAEYDPKGPTLNRARSQLRIEIRRAMGLRKKPKKAPK